MKICINNASFGYSKTILLDSINLEIATGEFTCIIGSNGSGKSTILKTLTNDLIPINGEIFLKNDYGNNTDDLQKSISYLPAELQDPLHITVAELVNLSRFNMTNIYNWKPSEIDIEKVYNSLLKCDIEQFSNIQFTNLSSGEKQRVWLAFCMAQEKKFLLLDESLSNLDYPTRKIFFNMLKDISRNDTGVLLASHDLDMVERYADQVLLIKNNTLQKLTKPFSNLSEYIF
tara:strand:+ start:854 stop:1546 length:693 start_codon:yes stop_codon:yes gene_type:complete